MDDGLRASEDALIEEVCRTSIERYLEELPDYLRLDREDIHSDVRPMCAWHSRVVLAALGTQYEPDPNVFRNSAIRRFYQGIPVQALLRSYELWAHVLWERFLHTHSSSRDSVMSLEFSLILNRHVDAAKSTVTKIYVEESSGRGAANDELRPDLLRELISNDEASEFIARITKTLRLNLEIPHAVVLVRPRSPDSASMDFVRSTLRSTTRILTEAQFTVAVSGTHGHDVVAVCSLGKGANNRFITAADGIAQQLPDVRVGVSRSYFSQGGFAHGYLEAQNSIVYAPSRAERRAYSFSDAVINRILRQSELTEELRRETIGPVEKYDAEHHSELLVTLQTYAETHFNLKQAAGRLHVQPNTVRYRLGRVHDLTGHDPLTSQGVFVLLAGLRLIEPQSC